MTKRRLIFAAFTVIFVALALLMPVRKIRATDDPGRDATERGEVIGGDHDAYNDAYYRKYYIELGIFAALGLISAWNAFMPGPKPKKTPE